MLEVEVEGKGREGKGREGKGREGLRDRPLTLSRFSQPSGLSIWSKWLFVADAEDSAVRRIDLKKAAQGAALS